MTLSSTPAPESSSTPRSSTSTLARSSLLVLLALAACEPFCDIKVPVSDINAGFTIADASWFEDEATLFVFYRVNAEQGIGPDTEFELAFRTDEVDEDFKPLADYPAVHTHVVADCGPDTICGSWSTKVDLPPRDVRLRMRYHKDGGLTLDSEVNFNSIAAGPAHTNRSFIVYGVFDETNTRLQWRGRHQFPTIRNEQAEKLGLRRAFRVENPSFGLFPVADVDNPYGYGTDADCVDQIGAAQGNPRLAPLGFAPFETDERAGFAPETLPPETFASPHVCGEAIVFDAIGEFLSSALAQKNPEVAPAFPLLRSPITNNRPLKYILTQCAALELSQVHKEMQLQRLQLRTADVDVICVDNFGDSDFAEQIAAQFQERFDSERLRGDDMVLVFALNHDDRSGRLSQAVEDALAIVLPPEHDKASPRVTGAFIFDTFTHVVRTPGLERLALWCPASTTGADLDEIPDAAARSCAIVADNTDLVLGPVRVGSLPIFPSRTQFETFINKYSEELAGEVTRIRYFAPQHTTTSRDVPVGDFGLVTFFNQEIISADVDDAFSFCGSEEVPPVFFDAPEVGPVPLEVLPQLHLAAPQASYPLGLFWDFPFLVRVTFETFLAAAVDVDAVDVTIPFGVKTQNESFLGTPVWETGEFDLSKTLLQCERFCQHPTFDSSGIYNVRLLFHETFSNTCYRPVFPSPTSTDGFPDDP